MELFGIGDAGRRFLVEAAGHAAHELGLFAALKGRARGAADLATELGVGVHRLAALLDVLAATGAARRDRHGYCLGNVPPRLPPPPASGWGRLAEVLRDDRPLPAEPGDTPRYHTHLGVAGASVARALAEALPKGSLLDLGSGAGTYARAYLDAHAGAAATLVDRAEVLALAEGLGPRARRVAGDALDPLLDFGHDHDLALLANVLHLHPPAICRALLARAAAALRPGGRAIVVDLAIAADRSAPLDALLFALNMALYTDGGTVYDAGELAAFLAGAGLRDVMVFTLGGGMLVVGGVKSG